jgi:chromate reductase
MKIIAIVGSCRKGSFNRQLAELARDAVGSRADFEILDYSAVPFFIEDLEYPAPASVASVREKIKQADGVWFFSPEYNHFFSGVLKNLLDWLSRPLSKTQGQVLSGKPTALSGVALGMFGTGIAQDHLVTLLSVLNMDVMNTPRLMIPNAMSQVTEGQLTLNVSGPYLAKQADAFLDFIHKGA